MFKSSKGLLGIAVAVAVVLGFGGWKIPQVAQSLNLSGGPAISGDVKTHILYGDKTGGGHFYGASDPCKAKFPKEWSEDDVLKNIRKVAANDNLKWEKQKNGYYTATDSVDGVKMRVVLDGEKDDVVTGYPLNGSANRCAKEAVKKSEVRKKQYSKTTTKKRTESTPKKVESTVDSNAPSSSVANASNRQPRTQNFNSR